MSSDKSYDLAIRKPTGMVHVEGGDFSELDYKVHTSAIGFIQRECQKLGAGTLTSDRVAVTVEEFLQSIGRDSNPANIAEVKGSFEKQVKLVCKWNILGADKRKKSWGFVRFSRGSKKKMGCLFLVCRQCW